MNPKVDPPGDGTKREELVLPDVVPGEKGRNPYIQIVFFDHITRRKH